MAMPKPSPLLKPTLDTKYHIDYSWWDRNDEDLRTYLISHLLPEQRERIAQSKEGTVIDYVHPETAEVFQLDEIGVAVQIAAKDPEFINPYISLVDCIFRVLLSNGNTPLSPRELGEQTGRPASLILKTLSGGRIYKGIRPYQP
jgi:hypothetical protein